VTLMRVDGMDGHAGWQDVYEALSRISGVKDIQLSLARGLAAVRHEAHCSPASLRGAIHASGHAARILSTDAERTSDDTHP